MTAWLKQTKPEIWSSKDLKNVNKIICYKYLKFREDDNKSPYTISKDMSALNRIFNFDLTKQEGNLNKRSYKRITRSRGYKDIDNHINFKNYKEIYSKSNNKLFNKYPKRIDNHSFRAKYARQLYKEYYTTSNDNETYRGYDKESILKVSKALGHNRTSVLQAY